MSRLIEFTKMHGAGNDYVYVDASRFPIAAPSALARAWSDRHKGIGADGLILICPSERADFAMRMFNADGSEGRMCGNASRCIAKYVFDKGLTQKTLLTLETLSGVKQLRLHLGEDGRVSTVVVDMGEPILADTSQLRTPSGALQEGNAPQLGVERRGTFVSMGNPHFVCFVEGVERFDVAGEGARLETAALFPERCNVEFAEVCPDGHIRMRVWERGSGITLACGTGACATAVAAALTGRAPRKSTIAMDGGDLQIEWSADDNHVYMEGPATTVFEGEILIDN